MQEDTKNILNKYPYIYIYLQWVNIFPFTYIMFLFFEQNEKSTQNVKQENYSIL
jgi:hypothetical protein